MELPHSPLCPWEIVDDEPYIPKRERPKAKVVVDHREPRTVWRCLVQGNLVKIEKKTYQPLPSPIPEKQLSHAMSRQARKRMLETINKVDWPKSMPAVFVSLTYPDEYISWTYKERANDRYRFLRYVERDLGRKISSMWRVEWEVRKSGELTGWLAPHMHFILLNVKWVDKEDVRFWWRKITKAVGPLCTDVQEVYDEFGAAKYLAKYLSKAHTLDISAQLNNRTSFGRSWGFTRPAGVPWAPKAFEGELTPRQVEILRSLASERFPWYDEAISGGFTFFGEMEAKSIARILTYGLDSESGSE